MRITVLGAGSWGTTVAAVSAVRHDVTLWGRDETVTTSVRDDHRNPKYLSEFTLPPRLTATADLGEAVTGADLVVVGVPSQAVRTTVELAKPTLPAGIPIVSLTKGLEAGTLLRMTEVIAQAAPGHPVAALTGPNIAREIMEGSAAASVIACSDLSMAADLQRTLRSGLLRIYTNHDVAGCEYAGALKNVVAIASGIAQGLGVGDNTRAAVMTRGLAEITRLGVAMGGEPQTFAGLAGMGDLLVTCISPFSRNRTVGERIGRGEPLDEVLGSLTMVAEGVKSARVVHELADLHHLEMPVCGEIYRVVTGQISPADAYRGLARPGHENEPG